MRKSTAVIKRRASAGAMLLDMKYPAWIVEVNPDTLHMESIFGCILGQLFGSYGKGVQFLNPGNTLGFGFIPEYGTDPGGEKLTREWIKLIKARRRDLQPPLIKRLFRR